MCSMHDHVCMKLKHHYVRMQHVAGHSRMLRGQVCGRRGAALTAGFAGLLPRRGGSHRRDVLTRSPRFPLPLGPCCGGCTCRLPPRAGSALRPVARMRLGAAAHMGAPCRSALEAILWCVRGTWNDAAVWACVGGAVAGVLGGLVPKAYAHGPACGAGCSTSGRREGLSGRQEAWRFWHRGKGS